MAKKNDKKESLCAVLRSIEHEFNIINSCWADTSDKKQAYSAIYRHLNTCPRAGKYYQLHPHAYRYVDRVEKVMEYDLLELKRTEVDYSVKEGELEDGIDYVAPDDGGLYFVGETHFNPATDQKYYCVKIGSASNISNRMKQYNTHNPMLWRIDYAIHKEGLEKLYQSFLSRIALAKCNHNEEWFFVDRDTYLEMCQKGFQYFTTYFQAPSL